MLMLAVVLETHSKLKTSAQRDDVFNFIMKFLMVLMSSYDWCNCVIILFNSFYYLKFFYFQLQIS